MFGVILTAIGTLFHEISDVIGRRKALQKEETIYSMGFLQVFWVTIFFGLVALIYPSAFRFTIASLPTFTVRVLLEIIQTYAILAAVIKSDRSTFGFVRTLTLPILLIIDLAVGYHIATTQIIGIAFIILALVLIFIGRNFNKKGVGLVLFGAVNSAATISLYKYDISHFNSVVAEQLIIYFILFCFLGLGASYIKQEHPFSMLRRRLFFIQSFTEGVGSLIDSFAYLFAPASIIVAAKRSSSVLWPTISGNLYFKEKHFFSKLLMFIFLGAGIILIVL
jgi:hypothetical protein